MEDIARILQDYRSIAVVGLSPNPERPSYRVANYLKNQGYEVIPVNPTAAQVLGEQCYPNLRAIPKPVEIVDIFRRPEEVGPIVDDAVAIGAKVIWMQEGIVNQEAATRARAAGLQVVMDDCMKKAHQRLFSH